MNLDRIRIVLVNASHPGNIGGAARAMKNMGLRDLRLVAPRRFPDKAARMRAAAAGDVLAGAAVVPELSDAIADCQFIIGASARGRRIPWPVQDARRCAERAVAAARRGERVAILFGREDRGLTNEELHSCNLHLHIPAHEDYTSLNLAMAVQIVAYELRLALLGCDTADECAEWDAPFSTKENMERFYRHLEAALIDIGFLDPAAPRQLMSRLRRLYGRVRLDDMELGILRGILTETQNAIRRRDDA